VVDSPFRSASQIPRSHVRLAGISRFFSGKSGFEHAVVNKDVARVDARATIGNSRKLSGIFFRYQDVAVRSPHTLYLYLAIGRVSSTNVYSAVQA
jgi:hypothetical protein